MSTQISRILSLLIFLIGVIVLLGWIFDNELLKSISPSFESMKANTAVAFAFSGTVLFLLTFRNKINYLKPLINLLSLIVTGIGLLTLTEYVFSVNLGLDELLFPDFGSSRNFHPGRMSILSSFNFLLAGICFLIETNKRFEKFYPGQFIFLMIFFINLFPLYSYLFQFDSIYTKSKSTTVPIHSSMAFLMLSISYFASNSKKGGFGIFLGKNIAGITMRNILLPLFLVFPILTILRVLGERADLYNYEEGIVLLMTVTLIFFTTIVIITGRIIYHEDKLKNLYKRFFDLSVDLLCIAGTDGFFKIITKSFTKTLGFSEKELLSTNYFKFIHPEDLQSTINAMEKLKCGSSIIDFVTRFLCKDGSYKYLLWVATPNPETGDVFAIGHDITQIKEAEQNQKILTERISQDNKQLANFAHITSHNLRAPVNNLNSLLKLFKESKDETGKNILMEKFEKVISHLSETLNELVESLKIREGSEKKKIKIVFEEVLKKTTEILTAQISETRTEIISDFSKAKEIFYPRDYIESIFLNLLTNAIKYRSPERSLVVRFESKNINNEIVLSVKDNGIGIDLNKYGKQLFGLHKVFHQNEDAKGVGLFLTKTQIEAMGGRIWVESQVDKGTTFYMSF